MASQRAMAVVGAGHAGGRAALQLRAQGWTGPIVVFGEEPDLPYERPALSKGLLTGEQSADQLMLAQAEGYAGQGITVRLGTAVTRIDTAARQVHTAAGEALDYEALLLATGGRARRLAIPGADQAGVQALRTLADARALQARLQPGQRLLIVGGGFIGLEVAASARARGCEVTLVEGGVRLMGRAVPAPIAERVAALHRAHGVDLRLRAAPESIAALNGRLHVRLLDGDLIVVDTVVAGIGIEPGVQLAREAGLRVGHGVCVDRHLRTSDPHVFAAGDVAECPSVLSGLPLRQETWQNAERQAAVAAANMLGGQTVYDTLPWFWSDQYDHTLQVAGEPALAATEVQRTLGEGAVLHFYLDSDGRVVGASGYGPARDVTKELKLARALVERLARPQAAALQDPNVKLKSLLTA